jgi:hypothetical protein
MHASDVHLRVLHHRHRRPSQPLRPRLLFADGHYFHVAGAISRPFHLDELGYRRYLTDSGKLELGRYRRYLKTPNAAYARLMTLLSKPWFWGILPHNCLVFVEEILQAGGATNFGLFSNCPVLQKNQDQWEKMVYDMRRKANELAIRQYMLGRAPF